MIDDPLSKVQSFVDAGASIITCHVESTRHPHRVLQSLAGSGVIRGVALNPGTPLEVLEPLLDELELVFLLAINPGWGGQKFLPSTERRLAAARAMIGDREILLEVDGGVTNANLSVAALHGPRPSSARGASAELPTSPAVAPPTPTTQPDPTPAPAAPVRSIYDLVNSGAPADWWTARRTLEPKMTAGTATVDEIHLLSQVCKNQKDKACQKSCARALSSRR